MAENIVSELPMRPYLANCHLPRDKGMVTVGVQYIGGAAVTAVIVGGPVGLAGLAKIAQDLLQRDAPVPDYGN